MISNDEFRAAIASMLERACKRVTEGVTDGAISRSSAEESHDIPTTATAGYTGTRVTQLHQHEGGDDDAAMLERAAIMEHDGGLPREIADGLAFLDHMPPPAGYTDTQWSETVAAMATFADEYGAKAIQLGWTPQDLFGLNPDAPAARYDGRGLASLLSKDDRVVMLTEDAAVIERPSGSRTTFRRLAHPAPSVLAWNLKAAA